MALTGEYEPSQNDRTVKQVELYEATNGVKGGTLNGKPVIVLTYRGAKSGKIRKTPLMRIEHNGVYAVVASYRRPYPPLLVPQYRRQSAGRIAGWRAQARDAGPRNLRRRKGPMVEACGRCLSGFSRLPSPCGPCRPRNSGCPPGAAPGLSDRT